MDTQETSGDPADLQCEDEPSGLLFGVISIGVLLSAGVLVVSLLRGLAS